jgi:hypothetical protein
MYDEEIWNNHSDSFKDTNADLQHIAARVMGRELNKIASRNKKLFGRIEVILTANTIDPVNSHMAKIMLEYYDNTIVENVDLLRQLKKGFLHNSGD